MLAESLLIASPLVVQGVVERKLGQVELGGEHYVTFEVRIAKVLRHLFGPESDIHDGMHIVVVMSYNSIKTLRSGCLSTSS